MSVVFPVVVALHVLGVVGMVSAAVLQVFVAPLGPFKTFKWVWLPSVALSAASGLLLLAMDEVLGRDVNLAKMSVKIALVMLSTGIAMKYHRKDRAETPTWAVPYSTFAVGLVIGISVLW
jgi:hypothetical protein